MNFAINDLVFVSGYTTNRSVIGKIGRIVKIRDSDIGVRFYEPINGHDLEGLCFKPYGYYIHPKELKKMEPLTDLLKSQWVDESSKLKKKEEFDPIILLE